MIGMSLTSRSNHALPRVGTGAGRYSPRVLNPSGPPTADVPEPAAAPTLVVHDLGPLTIDLDGHEVAIRGMKPTRILTLLLVNANRRVSVDTLTDVLWGDEVTDLSQSTLESHIWRLRKVMEPTRGRREEPTYLVNDAGGYRLAVGPANADSLRLVQLADQGDRLLASGDPERALGRYDVALSVWRGRPYGVAADDEWAAPAVARLEETHAHLREQRIEALLRLDAEAEAIGALHDLIAALPIRERLHGQLMTALYRTGRVEESLAAYLRARSTLLDTLGVEPGPALRDLHRRILDRDPELLPRTRSVGRPPPENRDPSGRAQQSPARAGEVHLPVRLSELIGRATELHHIGGLIEQTRLVTLVGAAGCGKTRLAIELARASARLAPDGVWFVDLSAVEDPATIASVTMSTIGLEPPVAGSPIQALRDYVRDRQILLVLDNCEHVLAAVNELLEALLGADSDCRILATSREPVGLDGEVLWTLAPLRVQDDRTDPSAEPSPAAKLFVARAGSTDPTFRPTPAAWAEIEQICAAVDGIPLAIELAAGRIRSSSLGEIGAQVVNELGGLGRVGYSRRENHRTIDTAIEWSVRLLSPAEQATHARLSVLPGIFTIDAATAVAGADDVPPADVSMLLAQLVNRSLLAVVPGARPGQPTRFRQLAIVRAHAGTAGADDDRAAARHRRRSFLVDHVAGCPRLEAEDVTDWYIRTEDNHDTLIAVLRDCIRDHPSPVGPHILARSAGYWFRKDRVSEGIVWLQEGLNLADADPWDRVRCQLALAVLHGMRDRTDLSLPLVRHALQSSAARRDRRYLAVSLTSMWWIAWVRRDSAFGFLVDEIRGLADGDRRSDVMADLVGAATGIYSHDPAAAAVRLDELRRASLDCGNLLGAWLACWLAAGCALINGDVPTGRDRIRDVDDVYRRLGGTPGGHVSVEFEANLEVLAGNHEQASLLYDRASRKAFIAGVTWPVSPLTPPFLADLRRRAAVSALADGCT